MGLWSTLVGTRRDLDLSQRWWHRLFQVGFTVVTGVSVLAVILIAASSYTPPTTANTTNVSLLEFTRRASRETRNTIPDFLHLPGHFGVVSSTGQIYEPFPEFELAKGFCAPPGWAGKPTDEEIDTAIDSRAIPDTPNAGIERGFLCAIPKDLETDVAASQVVKWRYKPTVFLSALGVPIIVLGMIGVVLLNLYYRGFVYVTLGPASRVSPAGPTLRATAPADSQSEAPSNDSCEFGPDSPSALRIAQHTASPSLEVNTRSAGDILGRERGTVRQRIDEFVAATLVLGGFGLACAMWVPGLASFGARAWTWLRTGNWIRAETFDCLTASCDPYPGLFGAWSFATVLPDGLHGWLVTPKAWIGLHSVVRFALSMDLGWSLLLAALLSFVLLVNCVGVVDSWDLGKK